MLLLVVFSLWTFLLLFAWFTVLKLHFLSCLKTLLDKRKKKEKNIFHCIGYDVVSGCLLARAYTMLNITRPNFRLFIRGIDVFFSRIGYIYRFVCVCVGVCMISSARVLLFSVPIVPNRVSSECTISIIVVFALPRVLISMCFLSDFSLHLGLFFQLYLILACFCFFA